MTITKLDFFELSHRLELMTEIDVCKITLSVIDEKNMRPYIYIYLYFVKRLVLGFIITRVRINAKLKGKFKWCSVELHIDP